MKTDDIKTEGWQAIYYPFNDTIDCFLWKENGKMSHRIKLAVNILLGRSIKVKLNKDRFFKS